MSPDAPSTVDNAPLIGRLETREGTKDLTVRSFADGPNAVPTNSHARIVADIAPDWRRDDERDDKKEAGDRSFGGSKF